VKKLIIYGEASKREVKSIEVPIRDLEMTLMDFLLQNNIPVASSCGGDGICQKCIVVLHGQKILSCQKIMREIFIQSNSQLLSISYL
jgi:ferredoxin